MAKIILASGGARSGKSAFAQNLAESVPGKKIFVATCPSPDGADAEMAERVARHQRDRQRREWLTIEEERDLKTVLEEHEESRAMLIDCLSLWVSNLLHTGMDTSEDEMIRLSEELVTASRSREGTVIFVTNEVGCGIVPENAMARKFRDLLGRCNQTIARGADEVIFFSCGLPLYLKKEDSRSQG